MATKNFTDKELGCKCGCGLLPSQVAQNKLQALRIIYASPIYIESGARCEAHNKDEGGKSGSHHAPNPENNHEPCAFDINVKTFKDSSWWRALFFQSAIKVGFTCAGVGGNILHIDCRQEYAQYAGTLQLLWTY